MGHTALLEIGVEEIPASVVLPALEQMAELAAAGFRKARLTFGEVSTHGTPRRLVILVRSVADRQPDITREVKGPPADKAFDSEGKPTQAALGFARKAGLDPSALEVRDTDKGRFVYAQVSETGLPAVQVLAELWPEIIRKLTFPKTMRWGHLTLRFARPIRWLVALYGSEGVPFEVAEVPSARTSRGHRFLSSGPVEVPTADDYLATLQQACVTVDHRRRQEQIAEQARVAAAAEGGRPRIDPALLEEVGFLIEYPTCLCGAFPEEYLALPEPVLVTVMAKHQRYFPVEDESGRLLPRFVAIRNGDDRSLGLVRRGNERVIVPRFADARFYYQEDTQRKLADRLPDLERVSFMERQGSLRDKTDRIAALAEDLIAAAGVGTEDGRTAVEAARLCKCDLVTLMVQDLTSLQGIMGAEYLRQEGSCEPVCMAVEEHYRPRFAGDDLPGTVPGALVSLADKLDNLAACFALDLIPKGTSDPYALRRQAAGVLAILLERRWRIDLWACLGAALARLPHCELEPGAALAALRDFLALRLDAALESAEVAYDLRRAALGALGPDLVDAFDRGLALSRARSADPPGFAQATFAAARVGKIIRPALGQAAAEVRPDGFEKAIENRLWDAFTAARARVEALLKADQRDYLQVWQALASLERPIWDYFDVDTGVMVMAEDPAVRANRLALLRAIDELFLRLADFTEIVVE